MSHDATNWAIKQRGIKPALKVVLWNLCDRYHPDNGCFPSQITLANDCEVPRSTLNTYLGELEAMGLIAREQRRDSGTNKQQRTRYRFPFEPDFPSNNTEKPSPEMGHGNAAAESRNEGEPSPENGESRVQNLDTNLVIEPVREPVTGEGAGAGDADSEENVEHLRKRFRALEIGRRGNAWPRLIETNADWAFRQFLKLTPEERTLAEERRDAFLAACPKVKSGEHKGEPNAPMLGVYLRDKRYEIIEAIAPRFADRGGSTPRPDNWAVAYGPVYSSMLFRILLDGPERPDAAPQNGVWLSGNLRAAWPRLVAFWQQADLKGGVIASERDVQLGRMFEFVPNESDVMASWRAKLQHLGLPEIRARDGMPGLYFPSGGPDGLATFQQAANQLRAGADGSVAAE